MALTLSQIPRNIIQGLRIGLSKKKIISSCGLYDSRSGSSIQPHLQVRKASRLVFPLSEEEIDTSRKFEVPDDFRKVYPEFLPDPAFQYRNKLREQIEREEMLKRRSVCPIPEFYVGSILAVTVSDPNAFGKTNRFVGICIAKKGSGLRAWFTLRNVVDHIGVEIMYEMYCPLLQSIEVLKLEKRLDEEMFYLRDCLPEYSTIPFDMQADPILAGVPVPVNPIKVKLKPRPWHQRWERKNLKGVEEFRLPVKFSVQAKEQEKPWEKYDLMKEYRATIPEEEQALIYRELSPHMPNLEASRRKIKKLKIKERRF